MSELFHSAEQMQNATNYNQWTFDQFKEYIHGDILEVGCGVGSFTKLITGQSNFDSMYCVDISAAAIDHIRKIKFDKEIRIECIDLIDVKGEFDLIICMNVMEHVEDDTNFFRKLDRLLKPGGVLFHLVPSHKFLYSNFDKAAGHYRRYTKEMMKALETTENTKLIKQYYFNFIGAFGYCVVYKILKPDNVNETGNEIGFFDKYLVPFSRKFLPLDSPIGLSLISIYKNLN